jgi:hypothetical protein
MLSFQKKILALTHSLNDRVERALSSSLSNSLPISVPLSLFLSLSLSLSLSPALFAGPFILPAPLLSHFQEIDPHTLTSHQVDKIGAKCLVVQEQVNSIQVRQYLS